MNRCRQTDALLATAFADDGLSAAQASHAAGCAECARALSLARRFDGELHRVGSELAAQPVSPTHSKGGRAVWRGALLAGTAVAVVALVMGALQVWRDGPTIGLLDDRPSAEQLTAWLDRSLEVAHDEAQPGGTSIEEWAPGRIELCGSSVIAFFDHGGDGSHGYLWAFGRPSGMLDESVETGWSRSLSTLDVARRRAEVPVCDVVLDDVRDPAGADLPAAPHVVVRVPDLFWIGDPEDAPVEVEVIGDEDIVVEVGIARDAYLYARLEDASIRAVDIVAPQGRYRYTVGPPGFTVWANVVDDAVRFEFLNQLGAPVRAGAIVDWPEDAALGHREQAEQAARRHAEEVARRAAERRAEEGGALSPTCADWRGLGSESQVLLIEELIADRVQAVRVAHDLGDEATFSEITVAAQAGLDKSCHGSQASRLLADIVEDLYPAD